MKAQIGWFGQWAGICEIQHNKIHRFTFQSGNNWIQSWKEICAGRQDAWRMVKNQVWNQRFLSSLNSNFHFLFFSIYMSRTKLCWFNTCFNLIDFSMILIAIFIQSVILFEQRFHMVKLVFISICSWWFVLVLIFSCHDYGAISEFIRWSKFYEHKAIFHV